MGAGAFKGMMEIPTIPSILVSSKILQNLAHGPHGPQQNFEHYCRDTKAPQRFEWVPESARHLPSSGKEESFPQFRFP